MTTCCCSLSQGVADSLKDMSPEQMQSMMKWATRAQRCMGVCGAPFKALSWVRERIPLPALPSEYRRPLIIAMVGIMFYSWCGPR